MPSVTTEQLLSTDSVHVNGQYREIEWLSGMSDGFRDVKFVGLPQTTFQRGERWAILDRNRSQEEASA